MYDLSTFYGPNAGYALELYERFLQDPNSVDAATRAQFEKWQAEGALPTNNYSNGATAPAPQTVSQNGATNRGTEAAATTPTSTERAAFQVPHVVAAAALAHAIRERGHLAASLDPLGQPPPGDPALLPETHGITEQDLALLPPVVVGGHAAEHAANALEAINRLRAMYSGTISYQFDQVKSPVERRWLRDAVGLQLFHQKLQPNTGRALLRRLTQAETFERFLHQAFPAQKRFSLEGNDVLVPMLDEILDEAIETGIQEVVIGMAHRGRLNVLAHILKKPYAAIMAEFSHAHHDNEPVDSDSTESGWSGDVKYHLGAEQILGGDEGHNLRVILSPNPSHLEFVNPVIQGMVRAAQEASFQAGTPEQNVDYALPIVIHGDAAFPGEGIVAETLNLWNLRGYTVGGAIHIIVNNQIGFTTEPSDGRSTYFASDLAKGFEIPIIHVNADDPEAALTAVRMAKAWRDQFHKDVMIDLIGYRRWGHNEGDEPAFTQPQMYETIRNHPTTRALFAQTLEQAGMIAPGEADNMVKELFAELETAKREADQGFEVEEEPDEIEGGDTYDRPQSPQSVAVDQLIAFNQALLSWPRGFAPNSKLARTLQRRATSNPTENVIDWGQAEALAFASILADGTPIRLSGQDAERGTFSHRHAVLHDQPTGATYTSLQHLPQARATFSIFNSPISEAAVLGFEYGYSVYANDTLVLWEAQFGDFANVAQVIIDQFISSGRAKWRQKSSLVLLLPHGYEGQGPEHSSARLERYLALCANENWHVANCSTAAQYFHLLRSQAFDVRHDPRPLVIMSPKSLLRHPLSATNLQELATTSFRPVLDDSAALARASSVRRVVLCTGKVGIDILAHPNRAQAEDVALVRIEMLYPFPATELKQILANYPNAREVVWVQEEPRNMGAWRYMSPRLAEIVPGGVELKVIARPETSSPATGFIDRYQAEQERLISNALTVANPIGVGVRG